MERNKKQISSLIVIIIFALFILGVAVFRPSFDRVAMAQETSAQPTPTPEFDQEAALAKLREEIKGKEDKPAGEVFENVQFFKQVPAGRLLAIMKFGYARSLGVDCTHCHTPDNWASEEKPTKQIARDMQQMAIKISNDLLRNMESLGGRRAVVNCTVCHRGQVKPATSLPRPKPASE